MDRRNFIKQSIIMAAAGTVLQEARSFAEASGTQMKFAMCNEMYSGWSLEKQFGYLAENGYDGVELAPYSISADLRNADPETFDLKILGGSRNYQKINKMAQAAGIQVSGLHCLLTRTTGYHLTSPDEGVQNRTANYFKELIRFCAETGGCYMVLGSPNQRKLLPGVSMAEAYDNAARVIEKFLPDLQKNKVVLAFEALAPNENEFIQTGRDALYLIKKMGAPKGLAIHLDCKAMYASEKQSIPEVIRDSELRPFMQTFHANDANLQGPGFGRLDFKPIMAALKEIKFDGWVGIEPLDWSASTERLTKESLPNLKKFL